MTIEYELVKKFEDKGLRCGNEVIIFKNFCDEFISACQLASLAIIGIESFYLLHSGRVKPEMGEIGDFSSVYADDMAGYVKK